MNKLTPKLILDKTFDIELKGYNADQVDTFLDVVLEDYQFFLDQYDQLQNKYHKLEAKLLAITQEKNELQASLQIAHKTEEDLLNKKFQHHDILERVSKLESEYSKK